MPQVSWVWEKETEPFPVFWFGFPWIPNLNLFLFTHTANRTMSAFPNLTAADHDMVKAYVTGADHMQYSQLPEDVVSIHMTHSNLSAVHMDLRLNLHSTIADVKERFRVHIGTPAQHQRLILKEQGHVICEMADSGKKLGYYSVCSGMELHVIDTDPYSLSRGGGLTDTSLVEKYRMNDDAYDQRKGTMREYIRAQKAKDPNYKMRPLSTPATAKAAALGAGARNDENAGENKPPPGEDSCAHLVGAVGSRCQVNPGERRGVVKYVGEVEGECPQYYDIIIIIIFSCGVTMDRAEAGLVGGRGVRRAAGPQRRKRQRCEGLLRQGNALARPPLHFTTLTRPSAGDPRGLRAGLQRGGWRLPGNRPLRRAER